MVAQQKAFSTVEIKALRSFNAVIDSFGPKNPRIERQEILCLMWIALNPGIARVDLMQKAGMGTSTVTRNCQRLTSYGWIGAAESSERSNALCYTLTTSGVAFIRRAAETLTDKFDRVA